METSNMNPQTMTCDECRDELARRDGWTFEPACWDGARGVVLPERWYKNGRSHPDGHPHPPTLDGANAAVPKGWNWYRQIGPQNVFWEGRNDTYHHILRSHLRILVPDTGNPMDDLYALALACRRAMEATNGKA